MKLFNFITEFGSGEWLLTRAKFPNGGTVVLLRATMTSILIYLVALGLRYLVDPTRIMQFDGTELRYQVKETLPWLGAIFAGAYAAFYSRFASQWSYLAGIYNQIKATESSGSTCAEALAEWKVGFIEDAQNLHLATKPIFASTIKVWSQHPGVKEKFVEHTPGGLARFEDLVTRVNKAHEYQEAQFNKEKDKDTAA